MVTYITALQPWGSVNTGNFVRNTERSAQEYAKHAVIWPAAQDWIQLETVCSKSIRTYGMRPASQEPTAEWIPSDEPGTVCSDCRKSANIG